MPQWSDFLDFNLLRPSTFERRHQQDYRGHRPTASTISLPNSLPSRQSTYTAPPAPDHPPSGYLGFHSRRQHSLDVRPHPVFTDVPPPSSINTTPAQLLAPGGRQPPSPRSRSRSTSTLHPRPVSTATSTPTTTPSSGFGLFASRLRSLHSSNSSGSSHPARAGSLEIPRNQLPSSSTSNDTSGQTPSRRPYFLRGSSWSGHGHHGHHASQSSQGSSTLPPPVPEVPAFMLARPTTGLDMTPRTGRMRRTPVEEDQQLSSAVDTDYPFTSEVAITIPPLVVTQATTMSMIHSNSSQDDDDREGSRAHTPTTVAAATTTTTLPRGSMSESRNNENAGLYLQRPLTAAQRRIVAQRAYLKKFMCIVATMPVLATLAVYNKIEVVMWWVIVVPLIGIAVALIWRRVRGKSKRICSFFC